MSNAIANQLYLAYLGRAGDTAWRSSTTAVLNGGAPSVALQNAFYSTAILDGTFSLNDSSSSLVNKIFLNVFGFGASTFEQNAWATLINNGTITAQTAAWTIFSSYLGATNVPSSYQQPAQSKLIVIDAYTNQLGNDPNANLAVSQLGSAAAQSARTFISTISSQATAAAGVSGIAATVAGVSSSQTGSSFTLTTGVDNLTGTSGNDTFTADNTGTNKQLSVADSINGGAGTDTLKVFLNAADTGTGQPTLTSIENVYVNGGAMTAYTAASGTTSLQIDAPVANTVATFTMAGQSLTLSNYKSTANTTTTVASTADTALNLTLNSFTATTGNTNTLDLSGTKYTTLNVIDTGANSAATLTNTGAALTTINFSGDKNLSLTESLATVTTVSASAATGALSLNVSGATLGAGFKFTGGAGGDTLTLKAGALGLLTAGSQLDGGAGTDTLVTNETAVLTGAQVGKINATANFETLAFGTTGSGVDVSTVTNTSYTTFKVNTGNFSEAFTNAASTSKFFIDNSASNTGTVSIANGVGQTSTTVTLDTGTAAAAQTLNTLTLTGITNVALTSSGSAGNIVTTFNNADNSAITVTGAAALTLTLKATAIGSRIDASGATGAQTLTGNNTAYAAGSSLGDVLIGGSAADTLKASVNSSTLTGNAGADTFDVSAAVAAATSGNSPVVTTITDFTKGDKLTVSAATTFTATKIDLTAATTQAAALDLLAGSATANVLRWGNFGGNTFVVNDTSTTTTLVAGDQVVKIIGVIDLSGAVGATASATFTF